MDNDISVLIGALLGLLLAVGVFLLLREFWCWYWKLNRIVSLLEESNELQRTALRAQGVQVSVKDPTLLAGVRKKDGDVSLGMMVCPQCLAEYQAGYTICSDCNVPLRPAKVS